MLARFNMYDVNRLLHFRRFKRPNPGSVAHFQIGACICNTASVLFPDRNNSMIKGNFRTEHQNLTIMRNLMMAKILASQVKVVRNKHQRAPTQT